jgi:delta endotoxin, N-terminal domain
MTIVRQSSADDYTVDPNDAAKTAVATALGEIPEAGGLLEGLVEIFWPESGKNNEVWDQIEQRVEALVQRDLSDSVYRQTQQELTGLRDALGIYTDAAKNGHTVTSSTWVSTRVAFADRMPMFQTSGYEILLLPLWAQAANMYLGLLRDGVLFGRGWGWSDADYNSALKSLQNTIKDYTAWAPRIFGLGMGGALAQAGADYRNCQPFRAGNEYRTQMIPAVLDLAARWPCFDPAAYRPPVSPGDLYLSREIYTDPVGTADDSGLFVLPSQPPTQPVSQITIWSEPNLIDAIQVGYPAGGGPDKVTQTPRMGSPSAGTSHVVTVPAGNPVVSVSVWAGDVVQGLSFTFKDGGTSPHFGSTGGTRTDFSFYDEDEEGRKTWQVLSSIYVNGMSEYYRCADSAVFGFQYERPDNP